jgi:ribonuclease inhibitor
VKQIIIDGQKMRPTPAAHAELKRAFKFPPHYGANLDALWDMLTEISEPVTATFIHSDVMVESIGPDGLSLLQTIIEAAIKNPNFKLVVDWEEDEDDEE